MWNQLPNSMLVKLPWFSIEFDVVFTCVFAPFAPCALCCIPAFKREVTERQLSVSQVRQLSPLGLFLINWRSKFIGNIIWKFLILLWWLSHKMPDNYQNHSSRKDDWPDLRPKFSSKVVRRWWNYGANGKLRKSTSRIDHRWAERFRKAVFDLKHQTAEGSGTAAINAAAVIAAVRQPTTPAYSQVDPVVASNIANETLTKISNSVQQIEELLRVLNWEPGSMRN